MISQLTVFLENRPGHLASATRAIADAGINMHALYLADTADFGVARIICDTPDAAAEMLVQKGFRASVAEVVALRLEDVPGSLASLLELCDSKDMNVEYAYCFITEGNGVVDVLKITGEGAEAILEEAGFAAVQPEELYSA